MRIQNFFATTLTGAALFTSILFSGCKKEKNTDEDYATEAQDMSQSEDMSTSIDNTITEAFGLGSSTISERNADPANSELGCGVVTWDSANSQIHIVFNNCPGRNGHLRNGEIIVTYQGGGYWTQGASWDVAFNNFTIDGNPVTGSRHVENVGPESDGCVWNINGSMTFTRSDGSTRNWSSTRTRKIVSGYQDPVFTNHVYLINGTATHSDSQSGNSCALTFTDLRRELSCAYITSGTITATPNNGRPVRTIYFGSGNCDDEATVTKNGQTHIIHLNGSH